MKTKRFIRLFFMLLLLIGSLVPQYIYAQTASKPAIGDGSKENPFQISSEEELLWFRDWVNGKSTPSHGSACAKLVKNIDMKNISWEPIGDWNNDVDYSGIFDGNGMSISNLTCETAIVGGLFCVIMGATIKNLTFENVYICNRKGATGAIAGIAQESKISGIRIINGKIKAEYGYGGSLVGTSLQSEFVNCECECEVSGKEYIGGLIGYCNFTNKLRNIFSTCNVTCQSNQGNGGLVVGFIETEAKVRCSGFVAYNKEATFVLNSVQQEGNAIKAFGSGLAEGFVLGCDKNILESGVVAYLLQQRNDADDVVWGQKLTKDDSDAYPILRSPNKVYTNDNVTLNCDGEISNLGTFTNEIQTEGFLEIVHKGTSQYIAGTPATCTKTGIRTHYECSNCSSAFEDQQLTTEMQDIIDPIKSHNYDINDICTVCKKTIPTLSIGNNTIKLTEAGIDNDNISGYTLYKIIPEVTGILEFETSDFFIFSLWNNDKTERLQFQSANHHFSCIVTANLVYYMGLRHYLNKPDKDNYTLDMQLAAIPQNLTGTGEANDPFILKNADHLKFFANYVNGEGTFSHNKACAQIADDVEEIDMSSVCHTVANGYDTEVSWTPIGSSVIKWKGVFDGNGKTISNLYINGNQNQIGLFGYVYGSIKDLTILKATVINNTSQSETGILMGYTYGSTIQNIVIDSKSLINAGECTGAIAGNANRTNFNNCINYAKVSGTNKVGGIAGFTENNTLSNVFGYGDVTATEENSGGLIVGSFSKTSSNGVVAYNEDAVLTINGTQVDAKATGSGTLSSTAYTKDEVKSGKLAYALNNGVTDGSQNWYQKLGEDGNEYPMMKSTGENTVYGAYHHGDKDRFFSNTVIANQHSVAYNVEAEDEANGNHDVSYEAGDYAWTDEDKTQAPTVAVTYTCKVCGNTVTPENMTVEHDAEHDNVAATCTEEGHNYYKTSYTFNDKAVFSNAYTQTLPALGHKMSEDVTFNNSKSIYQKGCTRENCDHHDYYATSDGSVAAKANDDASAFTVDKFTLNDATAYNSKAEFTVKELDYNRSFSHDKWLAVYVPFSIDCGQILDDYEMATINNFHEFEQKDGDYNVVLEVKPVTNGATIPALTPCLIRMKQAPEAAQAKTLHFSEASFAAAADKKIDCASVTRYYQFLGTLNGKTSFDETSDFVINEGELWPAGTDTQLSPQRWYLNASDREGSLLNPSVQLSRIAIHVIGGDNTTGIDGIYVKTDTEDAASSRQGIYDLQGRKLSVEPTSGIYIKDGKKYVK